VNNAGDPFAQPRFYNINTLRVEKELVEFYAKIILKTTVNMWGYCASGSTECVLHAMWIARKRFPNAAIYASEDSHFCVAKAADMLCMRLVKIPVIPKTGEMDMMQLYEQVTKQETAIVIFTAGTTVRNAYDNLEAFYGLPLFRDKLHIHIDGAFGGAVYPFVRRNWLRYSFDSFNVSFHKFLGCPSPCALFLIKRNILNELCGDGAFGHEMRYLPERDYTLSCSRNGSVVADMYIQLMSSEFVTETTETIIQCLRNKHYFIKKLPKEIQYRTHELGLSVELLDLPESLIERIRVYGLSVRKTDHGFDTHIYVCAHVTRELLDEFLEVLLKEIGGRGV
jgi:histidine decarboxylase